MDISTMGTLLAIVVITYLIGLLCKSVGSIRDELIPVIVGAAGGVLGIFPEGTRHKEGIMEHVESGVALIALRSGVPMIPLYIGGKPRLFRRLDVRVGDPIAMDDLRERGVNRDTCEELLARITETYRALTAHPEA